ncbi:hypothetical protein COO72_12425 [Bifidobacterium callitrichos]|nr:hypothetical protein COO72_12425 [Bifidobacterium callitrichos]
MTDTTIPQIAHTTMTSDEFITIATMIEDEHLQDTVITPAVDANGIHQHEDIQHPDTLDTDHDGHIDTIAFDSAAMGVAHYTGDRLDNGEWQVNGEATTIDITLTPTQADAINRYFATHPDITAYNKTFGSTRDLPDNTTA